MFYQSPCISSSFFFNDTATTEIYTLSLHDALPISGERRTGEGRHPAYRLLDLQQLTLQTQPLRVFERALQRRQTTGDRKSTRLNSSHITISYAVFCLKKKKQKTKTKQKDKQ